MSIKWDALWSFETDQFFVGFYAEREFMDPADTFCDDADIEAVRSGNVDWFCAAVKVYFKNGDETWQWIEVGSDYLGGCAYDSVHDFYTKHRNYYFRDMVRNAVADARQTLKRIQQAA